MFFDTSQKILHFRDKYQLIFMKFNVLEHFRTFLVHFWNKKWSRSQFCLIAGDVDHIMLIKDQIMLLGCVFIIFEHFKYRTPSKLIVFK